MEKLREIYYTDSYNIKKICDLIIHTPTVINKQYSKLTTFENTLLHILLAQNYLVYDDDKDIIINHSRVND